MICLYNYDTEQPIQLQNDYFPDNSLLMKVKIDRGVKYRIWWKYKNDSEIFDIYCLARHIKDHGGIPYLFLPYIPNARQDRTEEEQDVFTLKYFSEIVNMCGFEQVIVYDPHSPVSEALIDNLKVYKVSDLIFFDKYDTSNLVIYYPDNGAYKKYSKQIKLPCCYGVKNRNWETGKIVGLEIVTNGVDLRNKTVLIIDDIISYGGSMYYSAQKLKELGCNDIYAFATHVENSILDGDLIQSGLIKQIYTMYESIFSESHELIRQLISFNKH